MEFDITTIDLLKKACNSIIEKIKTPAVFFVEGELGAGKTTFIRHFVGQYLEGKKVKFDETLIHSPTYNLHNKYHLIDHFDLYRIEAVEEISNSGLFEFLNISNQSIVFIEWPKYARSLGVFDDLNKYEVILRENAQKNRGLIFLS